MNILTFDIEEWYLEKILHGGREFRYQQFDKAFERVLDELEGHGFKATFFCVGKIATDFPRVIREIVSRGHEVGCHSHEHIWVNKMTEAQLKNDTLNAIKALEDVAGQRVISYRAPAFSITTENKWAINVLAECGVENDASIFPTNRDFGGYKGFPQDTPCLISYEGTMIKEFHIGLMSVLGRSIAYSGGGFFRVLPYSLVSKTMKSRDYNICYFHLNDLIDQKIAFMNKTAYEDYFKEPGSLKNRMSRYVKSNIGKGDTFEKLVKLLSDHSVTCIRDSEMNWANTKVIVL